MRNWCRGGVAALILCAAAIGPATGQDKPRLEIVVEKMDDDAAKCGLTKSGIESTVALTLRNNGILTAPDTDPWLYAQVTVLFLENSRVCVADMSVSVKSIGERKVGDFAVRQGLFPNNQLCASGGMSTNNQAGAGQAFSAYLEELIKHCLGKLEY